jgi:hypothetical protein
VDAGKRLGRFAVIVLPAIFCAEVSLSAAGLVSDAPGLIAAPSSVSALSLQFVKTNPVGGAVVAVDTLALYFSVR